MSLRVSAEVHLVQSGQVTVAKTQTVLVPTGYRCRTREASASGQRERAGKGE